MCDQYCIYCNLIKKNSSTRKKELDNQIKLKKSKHTCTGVAATKTHIEIEKFTFPNKKEEA